MANLVLYKFDSCPFCVRVMDYMKENNITIPMEDTIENPMAKDKLLQLGGSTQVPCLIIDETPLYESQDIINWLKENWQHE